MVSYLLPVRELACITMALDMGVTGLLAIKQEKKTRKNIHNGRVTSSKVGFKIKTVKNTALRS